MNIYDHRAKSTTGPRTHVNAIPTSMMAATEESLNLPFTRRTICSCLRPAGLVDLPADLMIMSPQRSNRLLNLAVVILTVTMQMPKRRLRTALAIATLTFVYGVSPFPFFLPFRQSFS